MVLLSQSRETSRILLFFECEIEKGKVESLDQEDISEMKWLTLEEIKKHENLEPAMVDFFQRTKI